MTDIDKYSICKPMLNNLQQKLFSELSDKDQTKYRCSSLVDCGELYDISGDLKLKRVSKNFLASEFAYGKHDFIRIHQDLVFELEKLRYFFNNTSIKIITGYVPHSLYDGQKDYRGVQKNHVDGLAARISIKHINAKQLAEFAIIIGKSDTSISVGENDIVIAVNQREVDARVASHVRENMRQRASRPGRERAEDNLRDYYNYFHGQQSVEIARVLDNQYTQLRQKILAPKRQVDQDLGHSLFRKYEKEQIKLIENLHQDGKTEVFILFVLLYSDYVNVYLHHHRFTRENRKEQAFKRKNKSINKIKKLFCPSLHLGQFVYPGADYQRYIEYLKILTACNDKKIKIPFKRHHIKNDEYVVLYLRNLITKSIANKKQDKSLLTKPILGFDTKQLKNTVIAPDAPKYDITGRYEVHSRVIGVLGYTLVINQAGLHFEGVFSTVLSPQTKDSQKVILDLHGDIDEEGKYSGFFGAYQGKGEQITITLLKNKKIVFTRIVNGVHDQYIFKRYHDDPIFLSPIINGLGELVKRHEKAPLLIKQVTHLKNNFHQKSSRHKLEALLKNYFYKTKKKGSKSIEYYQSRTAEEINDYFDNVINNKEYGIHKTDSTLVQFYITYFLSNTRWAPSTRHDSLSIYDYLNLMVQRESTRKFGLGGFVDSISKYLGLPDYEESETLFKYKAVVKLEGVIFNKTLIGGGQLKGTLKISKIGDVGLWKKPGETTFRVTTYVVSIGKGTITKMEGETTFATPVEWFPVDFEGFVESAIFKGSLSAFDRKSIIGGFFMIVRNNKGSINLTFDESVFWKKSKSKKKPKVKPSIGPVAGINIMWILEQNASEQSQLHIGRSYFSNYISKFYTGTNKIYFIFDRAILVPAAIQTLRTFCALELVELTNKPSPVNMLIVGYADRVGTEKHNTDLSQRRADSVLVGIQNILKHKDVQTIQAETLPAGEKVAKYIGRDIDGKENPRFRGAKIFLNGRLALTLGDAILNRE